MDRPQKFLQEKWTPTTTSPAALHLITLVIFIFSDVLSTI
jgi:hypothetical protein